MSIQIFYTAFFYEKLPAKFLKHILFKSNLEYYITINSCCIKNLKFE